MSGGEKRNADKVNTIGIVVIGICASVLVYVSIVGLQAFYSNDSSDVQTMADYGGQETVAKALRADQTRNINEAKSNGNGTYSIPVKDAMKLVLAGVKADPTNLVPAIGPQTKPTIDSVFGRPKQLPTATPPAPASVPPSVLPGSDPMAPAAGSGSGSNGR
ncbi:MAG: hypothetical protein NT062_05650 [Proteobacteria bacterium]|nr:hypothetical protein [Pseudomonadota bacterium]